MASRKAELRGRLCAALRAISEVERAAGSRAICERLMGEALWREARSVLLFMPIREEPDVSSLLNAALNGGKRVALPRYRKAEDVYEACWVERAADDLLPGFYGIPEPGKHCASVVGNTLDLILVPGIGFRPDGGRLGRGKGYYDQLLASVPGLTCGVAFDCQITSEVPLESHDVVLNCILTPTRWLGLTSPGRF